MNNRIKKIRKEYGLTQQEFAERIGVKRNSLANYETGRNTPIDAIILSLCREFNINEHWLRTGEGEMRIQLDREEEIALWVGKILSKESDSFKKRLISALSRMDEAGWDALEKVIDELSDLHNKND